MFSRYLAATVLSGALAAAVPAAAEEVYKPDDIVKFFIESADLGAARGICIGTVQECEADQPRPSGLDMMINFELDSAELTEMARANLESFARALQDDRLRAARFVVEGHTDALGSANYNLTLSERRARSVTAFLLDRGVPAAKVEAVGRGMAEPRTENPFDPVNRRVEMRIRLQ